MDEDQIIDELRKQGIDLSLGSLRPGKGPLFQAARKIPAYRPYPGRGWRGHIGGGVPCQSPAGDCPPEFWSREHAQRDPLPHGDLRPPAPDPCELAGVRRGEESRPRSRSTARFPLSFPQPGLPAGKSPAPMRHRRLVKRSRRHIKTGPSGHPSTAGVPYRDRLQCTISAGHRPGRFPFATRGTGGLPR